MAVALYLGCILCAFSSAYASHVEFIPTLVNKASRACPCENPVHCKQIETSPKADKEVFVFSVHRQNWKKYDWKKITTVALFGYFDDELMCFAHSQNARVVYGTRFPMQNLTSATDRAKWVNDQLTIAQYYFLDGLNFDFEEHIPDNATELQKGLTLLIQELSAAFKKVYKNPQISEDVEVRPNRNFDMKTLSSVLDLVLIMAYGESHAHPGANSGYSRDKQGLQEYLERGVSREKLVLALPWYGFYYECAKYEAGNKCVVDETCTDSGCLDKSIGQMPYSTIMEKLLNSTTGRLWDQASQSPYFTFKNVATGNLTQVWYDDPQSLILKNNMADTLGLGGYGMWHADALDYTDSQAAQRQRREMWATLPDKK